MFTKKIINKELTTRKTCIKTNKKMKSQDNEKIIDVFFCLVKDKFI